MREFRDGLYAWDRAINARGLAVPLILGIPDDSPFWDKMCGLTQLIGLGAGAGVPSYRDTCFYLEEEASAGRYNPDTGVLLGYEINERAIQVAAASAKDTQIHTYFGEVQAFGGPNVYIKIGKTTSVAKRLEALRREFNMRPLLLLPWDLESRVHRLLEADRRHINGYTEFFVRSPQVIQLMARLKTAATREDALELILDLKDENDRRLNRRSLHANKDV